MSVQYITLLPLLLGHSIFSPPSNLTTWSPYSISKSNFFSSTDQFLAAIFFLCVTNLHNKVSYEHTQKFHFAGSSWNECLGFQLNLIKACITNPVHSKYGVYMSHFYSNWIINVLTIGWYLTGLSDHVSSFKVKILTCLMKTSLSYIYKAIHLLFN